jgi:hypothetical protein
MDFMVRPSGHTKKRFCMMKKKLKAIFQIAAIRRIAGMMTLMLGAMLVFGFVACGDGGGGPTGNNPQTVTYTGTANSTTYSLKITKDTNRAAYAPQGGDSYELTAGSNKSIGTVSSYTSGSLSLQPSREGASPFTATVSGNNLTNLTGNTTWDNGTAFTAPGALTSGGGGNESELPATNGKFTLTGTGAYDGQYAYAIGTITAGPIYGGTGSIYQWEGIETKNGTVELPMYHTPYSTIITSGYSGNDTITSEIVASYPTYSFMVYIMPTSDPEGYIGTFGAHFTGWDSVTFSDGCVEKSVSEGTYY